jgi:hypothetical protein
MYKVPSDYASWKRDIKDNFKERLDDVGFWVSSYSLMM